MNWQDFMYAAIGISVLVLAGSVAYTLSKVWPILDRLDEVSQRVEQTSRALRGPVRFIESVFGGLSKKGGD